ncbi:MAG: hypothetical protein M3N28_04120 [Actinomycetota bacterium]|nr:hypothetical protein [Actinomycetota bacterium]
MVEDLSYSPLHILHRLEELRPAKVVVVSAVARGDDRPGAVRRYLIDPTPPPPDEVHGLLVEALVGEVGLEQALAVLRHWRALPTGSVAIEIEPGDVSAGLGLSQDVAGSIDAVLCAVRSEIGSGLSTATTVSDERISELLAT